MSLRDIPTEWLEVYATVIGDDTADESDADFAEQVKAIYRMHEIEVGEGVFLHGLIRDAGAARIELDRRRGVKPRAPELMSRSDAVMAVRRCLECRQWDARMYLDMIPAVNEQGKPPWYGQRRWHRLADVQALLNGGARSGLRTSATPRK